jgi:hypothetical protein
LAGHKCVSEALMNLLVDNYRKQIRSEIEHSTEASTCATPEKSEAKSLLEEKIEQRSFVQNDKQ